MSERSAADIDRTRLHAEITVLSQRAGLIRMAVMLASTSVLLAALLDLRRKRKEALLADGKNTLPATNWIFENEEGGFQDMKNLKKRHFHKCLEKAGWCATPAMLPPTTDRDRCQGSMCCRQIGSSRAADPESIRWRSPF
jgi:hypothetical protein